MRPLHLLLACTVVALVTSSCTRKPAAVDAGAPEVDAGPADVVTDRVTDAGAWDAGVDAGSDDAGLADAGASAAPPRGPRLVTRIENGQLVIEELPEDAGPSSPSDAGAP